MGADHATTMNGNIQLVKDEKILEFADGFGGKALLGMAGTAAAMWTVRDEVIPHIGSFTQWASGDAPDYELLDRYALDFARAMTAELVDCKPTVDVDAEIRTILGIADRMYLLGANVSVPVQKLTAIGSGMDVALGYLEATMNGPGKGQNLLHNQVERHIQRAIYAAVKYDHSSALIGNNPSTVTVHTTAPEEPAMSLELVGA